ncbi:armadillo-type protein [Mycena galericulata]|nr:armadillo-type protein [Mycena galericulata]
MPPLTRQQSRASIYSWWSDSNPGLQGPTINLHTVTKPLLKLMYHRQALGFIQRNGDTPLSSETLEIYSTYLLCKYVSASTQADILRHLTRRAESDDDARAIADSAILVQIPHLLGSAIEKLRVTAGELLIDLVQHETIMSTILATSSFEIIVSLLKDEDVGVIFSATSVLASVAFRSHGAQAIVNTNTLTYLVELLDSQSEKVRSQAYTLITNLVLHEDKHPEVTRRVVYVLDNLTQSPYSAQAFIKANILPHLVELLDSASKQIRENACVLVGNLARHESCLAAILAENPFEILVSLLRDADSGVIHSGTCALAIVAYWPDGAQAVINANILPHLSELLGLGSTSAIQANACILVRNLAQHESSLAPILAANPFERLVCLLRDTDSVIIQHATAAISEVAYWADGAQAVIKANTLPHLSELLESTSEQIQKYACILVGNLALYESALAAIVAANPFERLVSLLQDANPVVIQDTTYALANLAYWFDAAQAVINANTLPHLSELLESASKWEIRANTCFLAGNLARHESTSVHILDVNLLERLVSLLRDAESGVIRQATSALGNLAYWVDGAQAVINANTWPHLSELLESASEQIREKACVLVGNLARHESSLAAILSANPCETLVSLLRDTDSDGVIQQATYALQNLAYWPDGAQAVIHANMLQNLLELLESASEQIREKACLVVGNLARHESSLAAILAVNPFKRLVSLLRQVCNVYASACALSWTRDQDIQVIQGATYALRNIAYAIIKANMLQNLSQLLDSASEQIRENACGLVGNLADYESSLAAILAANPFGRLVSLDADSDVIQRATYALANLAFWPDGAQAIINANALLQLSGLLESASKQVQESACMLVGNLAMHVATAFSVLDTKPCARLVSLLSDEDADVMEAAIYALSRASCWLDGAQATVDAMGADHIPGLLESASSEVLQHTCRLVGNLASYESTALAVLALKPCPRLVKLLRDTNIKTRAEAVSALARISKQRYGVAVLVRMHTAVVQALGEISELSDDNIQKKRRTILENLSRHQEDKAAVEK